MLEYSHSTECMVNKPVVQYFTRIDIFTVSTVLFHFDHSKKHGENWLLCQRLDKTNLFLCTGVRNHIINDWLTVTSHEWVVSFYASKWQTEEFRHYSMFWNSFCNKLGALQKAWGWGKHYWNRTETSLTCRIVRALVVACVTALQNLCLLINMYWGTSNNYFYYDLSAHYFPDWSVVK